MYESPSPRPLSCVSEACLKRLLCPFEAFNYDRLAMLLPIFHIFGILWNISWQVHVKPLSKKFEQNFHAFWCMVSLLSIYKYFMYTSYNTELPSANRPKVWGVILLTWSMTLSREPCRLHIAQQNRSSFYGERQCACFTHGTTGIMNISEVLISMSNITLASYSGGPTSRLENRLSWLRCPRFPSIPPAK